MRHTDNQPTLGQIETEKKRLLRATPLATIIHTDPYTLEADLRSQAITNLTGGKA